MDIKVFFNIFAICVKFFFADDSIPTCSPTNGTSEVLNVTNQELAGDQNGTEHIFDASLNGNLARVKYWYRQDPSSIHGKFDDNYTTLHFASLRGHLPIVQFLLSKGVEVDPVETSAYTTPLLLASFGGHVPVVEALLDKGANVNHQAKYNDTPLQWAVRYNNLPVVKVLINRGADTSIRGFKNVTALDMARDRGLKPIQDYLSSL